MTNKLAVAILIACGFMMGCADSPKEEISGGTDSEKSAAHHMPKGKLFGENILSFGGNDNDSENSGIGINHYLWRASLDTISFMPLRSADPFGGVILTEWYSPAESSNERFKVDIRILDRQLRADGIRVSIHKQRKNKRGDWEDIQASSKSSIEMEEVILTRARQFKINEG